MIVYVQLIQHFFLFKQEKRPDVDTKGLPCLYKINCCCHHFYGLSHQTLVLNLSAPCAAIAAFTLVVFIDNSEVG